MNKNLVKTRFEKNLDTYKDNANIQKKMAQKLVSYLDKKNYPNILEIGCGTGFLTEILNNSIEFETYIANDIVPKCSDFIQKINPNINFVSGDIEELINNSKNKYDLIVSNASLQWVDDFFTVSEKLLNMLKPNGVLLFSTFGVENFREIFYILGKGLRYYSKEDLTKNFIKYNPIIEEEIHIMTFKTPKDVLKHLRYTGVNAIESKTWTKKDIKEFENNYNNFCSNHPSLTYNPIYVKLSNISAELMWHCKK